MEKSSEKSKLLYALFSALSFVYLILPPRAGVSVSIFALLQIAALYFVIPDRKRLWLMSIVLIFSLNSFYSAFRIYDIFNYMVNVVIYSLMFVDFDMRDTSLKFLADIIKKCFEPFKYLHIPFALAFKVRKEKSAILKRVLAAILITVPALLVLALLMSSADMVFSAATEIFSEGFSPQ